jgi:site-specific DNA-methyltransferase (adenine-specific)
MDAMKEVTFLDGRVRLILGDCRDVLPTLGKVDALVTDPPYGVGLGSGDRRGGVHGLAKSAYETYEDTPENFRHVVVPAIARALMVARRGAVFCNNNLHDLPKPDAIGGVFLPSALGSHCWGYNSLSVIALYGTAPGLNFGRRPSAISSTDAAEKNGHPCPKPLAWMTWIVSHASLRNETILDPFMGSGTTGVAAVKLGRRFIGVEIEPKYFDIACRRIEEATKQPDLFIEPAPEPKQGDLLMEVAS